MTAPRNWVLTAAQLALAAAWLMAGIVYVFTPPRMASLLGMSDSIRVGLGIFMALSALLAAGGALTRIRTTSLIGVSLLTIVGVAFTAYDAVRHWTVFTIYDGALALLSIGLLVVYVRKG